VYSSKPAIVYGFHGLDKTIAYNILNQKDDFKPSNNSYDWLGDGIYFWENNFTRAKEYAEIAAKRQGSTIKEPFVLGAVIELGNCLDLLDQKYINLLEISYQNLKQDIESQHIPMPINSKFGPHDFDFKKRELDCAVIRYAHKLAESQGERFDSVRAAFWEGDEIYPGAGFRKGNHIQIAIRNPDCIKGIFLPREKTT
jgi:hypothetical protein